MKFHDVPMTESDAISEGWTKTDSKACDGKQFSILLLKPGISNFEMVVRSLAKYCKIKPDTCF